jgi:acetoacetyl-CoA synthetase
MTEPGTLDPDLIGRVRRELAQRASPAHVPGLVVEVSALPVTHSGKRSERAARDAVNGVAAVNRESLANPASLDDIQSAVRGAGRSGPSVPLPGRDETISTATWLRGMWETILGIAPIGSTDNFFEVGGTSLGAVRLLTAIHDQLGVDLPLSMFMHAQTVDAMAAIIDARDDELGLLVPLREGSGDRPLFIMHGLIGDIYELRAMVEHLETDRPVYGVRARGLDPRVAPDTSVEDMAVEYIRAIKTVQPSGPYALGGYSFGGLTAFEMARRLVAAGERVDRLLLIDAYLHESCLTARGRAWFAVAKRARLVAAGLQDPRSKLPRFLRRTAARVLPFVDAPPPEPDDVVLPPLLRYIEEVDMGAYEAYRPGRYPGSAWFIKARRRERRECNPVPIWSRLISDLSIERVPGGHFDIMTEPHVRSLAASVSRCLGKAGLAPGGQSAN